MEELTKCGLLPEEQIVLDNIYDAHRAFLKLPVQHPGEIQEMVTYVHGIQSLLALRIARRKYPEGWITH